MVQVFELLRQANETSKFKKNKNKLFWFVRGKRVETGNFRVSSWYASACIKGAAVEM